ncbi:MAG: aminoglycoside phosphotransferase family protein [Rudaea sp.]|uniref:phosphotransferase family protein n=1 Tax=Rudaea sp. TaxID=2136325 RepID=UPI0039E6D8D1
MRQIALDGGISSDIRVVQTAHGDYVVKRARAKLRVEAEWFCDPTRSSVEVAGLRAIAALLGQTHAPKVLWVDETTHRFAMELIEPRFRNWKRQLLRGHVDIASAAGAGRLLGQLHARSSRDPGIAARFANTAPFVELRVRPFFERIAQRNPALAASIAEIVQSLCSTRNALVHGDYSPKNLLVDGSDVVILDCEVAHWGDARFDVAFCLAHLLLKMFRRAASVPPLLSCILAFLEGYRRHGLPVLDRRFVRQLGCLVLARLEGDSPVDYLGDLDADEVKRFATELILRPAAFAEFGPDIADKI